MRAKKSSFNLLTNQKKLHVSLNAPKMYLNPSTLLDLSRYILTNYGKLDARDLTG